MLLQMSIVSSLLLVLLWFSFHACDARSFGVLHNGTSREFHHSISKENEKLNPARVSIQPDRKTSTQNDAARDAKEDSRKIEKEKVDSTSEPDHKPGTPNHQAKRNQVKVSGGRRSESVASVSWRVPHKKRGEKEPGFNLDYLPPKTHPPVHN